MKQNFDAWIAEVETARPAMDTLVSKLTSYGATAKPSNEFEEHGVRPPLGELPYKVSFQFEGAETQIWITLMDHQSSADVVITNMTTLPASKMRKGCGSKAVARLMEWARDNKLKTILATQVNDPKSAQFWAKNGFVAQNNVTSYYLKTLEPEK